MSKQSNQNRAVIYARFSSHKQDEQSIEGQLRDCYAYAEREGVEVIGEYIDRAISGTTDKRPDFQRLISDSEKQLFKYVIVWKLDRFARSVYDSLRYEHELASNNVTVLSAAEGFGKGDEAFMIKGVKRYMNEYFSKDLSMKTKRGMRESVLKGNCIGGIPLYGYKFVDKKIVIDEEKAEVIRYIFEEYAKGKPKIQIIRELHAKGVRNSSGNPLTATSFQNNYRNKKYIGIFNFKGEDYYDVYPPIISEETFYKVQANLKFKEYGSSAAKGDEEYALFGKVFCGICGNTIIGDCSYNTQRIKYTYYVCSKRKKSRKCSKKRLNKDSLEMHVVDQTKNHVFTPDGIERIAKGVLDSYNDDENNIKINSLKKRVAKINRNIDKCFDIILDSDNAEITKRAEKKAESLKQQKQDIESNITHLQLSTKKNFTKDQIVSWLKMHSHGDSKDFEYRQRIIDIFIKAVYLYDDKVVTYYNLSEKDQRNVLHEENAVILDNFADQKKLQIAKSKESQSLINPAPDYVFKNGYFGLVSKV